MKKSTKIIIVGAGPIGCYMGQLLKNIGYEPLLLEEHSEVGKPVQCAGIVGQDVFNKMHLPVSRTSILNIIDGANISFNGTSFSLSRPKVAYIIDRCKFDKNLSMNLNIEFNARVQEISKIAEGYVIKIPKCQHFADIVIGCDGANSRVRKSLNFNSNMRLYRGYQYRIKAHPKAQNRVEVKYLKPFSLFSWVIPEGNGTIRVGTISNNPFRDLNAFIENNGYSGEILEKNAGTIPIGTCDLVKEKAALVGDAACQIKPITSGGIYYGMKSAEMLAEAIKEGNIENYTKKWAEEFEQEIKFCILARYIMENINNGIHSRIFNYVKENSATIEKMGDFENHSTIIWSLIANPRTYSTIASVFLGFLKKPKFLVKSIFRPLR